MQSVSQHLRKVKPFIPFILLGILFVGDFLIQDYKNSQTLFESVEVGVATPSQRGGIGLAIPASCPSYNHSPNECGPCYGGGSQGVRLYEGGQIRRVAFIPTVSAVQSDLKFYRSGTIHSFVLVGPSDPYASKALIQTADGIRALCLLPFVPGAD